MKNSLLFLFFALPFSMNAQKIALNEVDEFTKKRLVSTDWFSIAPFSEPLTSMRVSKVDSQWVLSIKRIANDVYGADGKPIYLLFEGDSEAVVLNSSDESDACRGCGATGLVGSDVWGIYMIYPLPTEIAARLKKQQIAKFRITTGERYLEHDFTSEKKVKFKMAIQKAFILMWDEK